MFRRKIIWVLAILIVTSAAVLVFGNNVLMELNTDAYIRLSLLRTYSNITKKNKNLTEVYKSFDGKPLQLESNAETVNTNISVSGFKIRNVSITTDLAWDKRDVFFAENKLRLGVFTLARIDLFGNENELAVLAPQVTDEYIVFDKKKLQNKIFKDYDKWFAEIADETVKLFAESFFSYEGRQTKIFAGADMDLYKFKLVLSKKDSDLYLQKVNTLVNLSNINVIENAAIYVYTNKKHQLVAFEIGNIGASHFDIEVKFALLGEKWLLNEFACDIEAFCCKNIQVQAKGSVELFEKNKIALTMEPVNILTDFVKTDTQLDVRISAVLSEADNLKISFPKNKSIKYEELQKNKIKDVAAKFTEIINRLENIHKD